MTDSARNAKPIRASAWRRFWAHRIPSNHRLARGSWWARPRKVRSEARLDTRLVALIASCSFLSAALIATALILTWGNRGPLIDTSERPLPTVPEWTPATCCEAVEYQEEAP